MSVPRGTRELRLSVRVGESLKDAVRDAVRDLRAEGLATTESELVACVVDEAVTGTPRAELSRRLVEWRRREEMS